MIDSVTQLAITITWYGGLCLGIVILSGLLTYIIVRAWHAARIDAFVAKTRSILRKKEHS